MNSSVNSRHIVVVGSGIAGLVAALHAARQGHRVTVVTKGALDQANTAYAQGGIAGVLDPRDRTEDHLHDTLIAGAGLCDVDAVRILVTQGPDRLRELIGWGVPFDRNPDGSRVAGLEAAHSFPRIAHAGGDATGRAIEDTLIAQIRRADIAVLENTFLADVVVADGRVRAAAVLPANRGVSPELEWLEADAVILATGGAGQLYRRTTNPAVATGDGIAAALRAGAAVADLEFVQFHPTVLAAGEAFLVSEAVRGEGAVLLDAAGNRFMVPVHPDAELAPRDVVARQIALTMAAQGGAPVWLDATRLRPSAQDTADFLTRRFPTIDAAVHARGLDWARELIPVTPAAHYLMGGVVTDTWGRTTLPGLYAAGEVARTGVHGANRLASNSLLEGAVFGARAARAAGEDSSAREWPGARTSSPAIPRVPATPVASLATATPSTPGSQTSQPPAPFSRAELQGLMWRSAGLLRNEAGLSQAARTLAAWQTSAPAPRTVADREDANLLQLALAVVAAARARITSVGAHYRSDAPTSADATPGLLATHASHHTSRGVA